MDKFLLYSSTPIRPDRKISSLAIGTTYSCIYNNAYGIIVIDDIARTVSGTVLGTFGNGELTIGVVDYDQLTLKKPLGPPISVHSDSVYLQTSLDKTGKPILTAFAYD